MSDTYSIIYSSEAKDDLREIYSYIAYDLQAPETAEGQVNRIRKEIRSLANVKHFFTLLGKMFFTPYGKEFFTYPGKQIFTS